MGVTRRHRIRNATLRKTLGVEFSILDRITWKRMYYFGHIQRMPPSRLPKMAFECHIQGVRPRVRPPKRWRDCLLADHADCKRANINSIVNANRTAEDRTVSRDTVMRMPPFPSWSERHRLRTLKMH
ncbi:uncharacterized protein [Amphiura filiformis]|uniref:uncharacterized protein n=1 Tax=Amphiura filiformis TaxID=82378 RepID=UPI003B2141BF